MRKSLLGVVQEREVAAFVTLTLEQMADNGLRDHLGGGFFRYTVDPAWQEPHFEKMLSDNAQMASLYLEAARKSKRESFQHIGQETLDFILREMRHPAGGFISALSAVDADGVEGGYYLWNDADLNVALRGDDINLARQVWGLSGGAHWERGYLPLPQPPLEGVDTAKRAALKRQLWLQRNKRMLPRDEKRLASANALTLIALSEAYGLSDRYVTAGNDARDYLHRLWDGKRLWRMLDMDGTRWLPAGLEEYAYTALALLKWDAVANDEQSRKLAARLVAASWQRFYGENGWLPGDDATLVGQRQPLLPGDARPSPVVALFEANLLLGERAPVSRQAMAAALTAAPQRMLADPLAYSGYLKLLRQLSDE
jgi:hypothetical protein